MRQLRKTCSFVLAAALTLGLCATGQTADMKAKKKSAKVSYVKVTNVKDGKLKMQKGKSFQLKTAIKVSPNKKKNRKIKFSSSNKKVIFVSSKGKIKAKKNGKAKITVKSVADPKKKAVISVTVTKDILVKSITLNKTNVVTNENNEDGIQFSVTKILPANAKNKGVEWDTSDDEVADVDDEGLVNINGAGTVTITCFAADDGGASATCKITVNEVDGDAAPATEAPAPAVPDGGQPTAPDVGQPTVPDGKQPTVPDAPVADPSEEPETSAPATEAPETDAPATAAPVTEAPTTDAPATVAPATEAPETAIPEPAVPSSATPMVSDEPSQSARPDIPAPIESDTPDVPDETATPEPVSDSYTVTPEMFDEEMSDISSKDISVCKDANGREYMQIKFSKRDQYAFFKLPEPIDLSDYKNVQIVANVPGQLMFCTFDETLDKQTASWWTKSQFVTYPFYQGSYPGRLEDGTAAGVMGIERQIYALSSVKANDTGLPTTYVVIATNGKPEDGSDFDEVVYDIYSIKFFNEDQDDDWQIEVSASPSPATEAPTATPRIYDENLADRSVSLDAEHLSPWSANGYYGQVKFNLDGSVAFSSQPTAIDEMTGEIKSVNVYNNGCSFYIGEDADTRTDLSDYHYVAIRLKTDTPEVKIMTWAGGDDADNFWDKSDTWGNTTAVVDNADGSSTYIYDVVTLFGKKANKAKAIGFTLRSNKEGTTGNEDGDEEAKEAELYSITFTNKLPEVSPTPEPGIDESIIANDFESDWGNWYVRFNEEDNQNAGYDTKISISDEAHTGQGAMLISNRYTAWNSPALDLEDVVIPGAVYNVSFWAKVPSFDEDYDDGIKLRISGGIVSEEGGSESYQNYPADTDYCIAYDEWTYCETTFIAPEMFYTYFMYIESNGSSRASFLIDDFELKCLSGSAAPSETENPVSTPKQTTEPTPTPTPVSYDETLPEKKVILDKSHVTPWSTNGNYGQVKFNSNGSVTFSSQPTAYAKDDDGNETDQIRPVSVYNNGCGFYIGDDAETKTDLSAYHYAVFRIKEEDYDAGNFKVMTWSRADDADNFWDKTDTWGMVVSKIENEDGTVSIVYEIPTIFGKNRAKKAKAIGFTLRSIAADGSDSEPGVAQEATLYSITFTNKLEN